MKGGISIRIEATAILKAIEAAVQRLRLHGASLGGSPPAASHHAMAVAIKDAKSAARDSHVLGVGICWRKVQVSPAHRPKKAKLRERRAEL